MANFREVLTLTETRVWLLYAKVQAPLFARVSVNILREVCAYIGYRIFPCIYNSLLNMHNLDTGKVEVINLKRIFSLATVCCLINDGQILCVGGLNSSKEVWTVDAFDGALAKKADMQVGREWPGLVYFRKCAYAFGGNICNTLSSAEKFAASAMEWNALPDMLSAKVAFSPVPVADAIYLCCPNKASSQFEVFNIKTESYKQLPLSMYAYKFGSVAFLVRDELVIVTFEKRLIRWKLGATKMTVNDVALRDSNSGLSKMVPMSFGNYVYWCGYVTGTILTFDKATGTIKEIRNR